MFKDVRMTVKGMHTLEFYCYFNCLTIKICDRKFG